MRWRSSSRQRAARRLPVVAQVRTRSKFSAAVIRIRRQMSDEMTDDVLDDDALGAIAGGDGSRSYRKCYHCGAQWDANSTTHTC